MSPTRWSAKRRSRSRAIRAPASCSAKSPTASTRDGFWRGELPAQRSSGEIFPTWTTVATVRGASGETTHYVITMTDVTDRKRAEKEIVNLAYYDRLTGLPNRRLLRDRLEQALAGSARSGRHGALLFIDLDNFKLVNETSGHEVGDQLLVEVARRLEACLGAAGGAARVGGDEFVALVEDLSENPHEAAALAKKTGEAILAALNAPYALPSGVRHSSPSIGVAMFSGGGDTCEELLKQADIAMYEAKAAGRNALRFFDPDMQATLAARAEAEAALRLAIRERRFVLHYQPQVDCDGEWIGAEALLRWAHPERGLVAPGEFIPLAEETGLILPIGRWVLETACQRLKAWSGDRRSRDLHLSVNVSARQFSQPDFVEQVAETLRATGAPAERLVLELTESVMLDDVAGAADKMNALKALGVGFAVDDFGTGYSSLAYLTRLPLDQIKIDRSFVRNLPGSANDAAVAHTIITLAESLGLAVIAEGVETEAQRRFLERHGCPSFQGFLFGKPMPIDVFEAKLAGSARSGRHGALLFIDLDNFKLINETSGHEVGDQLLVEVARRLEACLGAAGGAARVGGDEFVALVEDLSENRHEAAALAKKTGETILAALNAPYALPSGVRHSSPSIGVAMFSGGGDTCEELLKQADIAMYEAKAAGRNALRFFDPDMQATLAVRAEAEAALRLAIRERRFVLHYQPQVDCDGEWIGAEALLRWAHPERGLVAPGEFIPARRGNRPHPADRPLGAGNRLPAAQSLERRPPQPRPAPVGQRQRPPVQPARLRRAGRRDVARDRCAGRAARDRAHRKRRARRRRRRGGQDDALKALGVCFAVDDFGTGYSSLAYLTRLPLDQIKIDRSFVRNLPGSANDAAVAHTIITLAESLGLAVIAEGVETEAQRRFLERHGCPSFQGFLFGKPMPIDVFEAKLA